MDAFKGDVDVKSENNLLDNITFIDYEAKQRIKIEDNGSKSVENDQVPKQSEDSSITPAIGYDKYQVLKSKDSSTTPARGYDEYQDNKSEDSSITVGYADIKQKHDDIVSVEHNIDVIHFENKNEMTYEQCDYMDDGKVNMMSGEKCSTSFEENILLQLDKSHGDSISQYTCYLCKEEFDTADYLEEHLLTHRDDKSHSHDRSKETSSQSVKKPHNCKICNKEFFNASGLNNHMLIHTGEKPHKCDICGRRFIQAGSLRRHMLTHTGEKPHRCNICEKQFLHARNLKQHMWNHTGEKLHKCDDCEKTFTCSTTLKYHMMAHRGEMPHKCEICEQELQCQGA